VSVQFSYVAVYASLAQRSPTAVLSAEPMIGLPSVCEYDSLCTCAVNINQQIKYYLRIMFKNDKNAVVIYKSLGV